MAQYIYPKLPASFEFILRFGGSGLGNCLFVFSRAIILSRKYNLKLINPTWRQINIGPYKRNEKDKRHYFDLFKPVGISGIRKQYLLITKEKITEEEFMKVSESDSASIVVVQGLKGYFEDLIGYNDIINKNLQSIINFRNIKNSISGNFCYSIAMHIRRGDFKDEFRTDLNWYIKLYEKIMKYDNNYSFFVFSDGTNEELNKLLKLPRVTRAFFGNAIGDIIAMSKCKLILGSDSTFSGWASFIGKTPIIFPNRHYGRVHLSDKLDYLLDKKEIESFTISKFL